MFEIDPAFLPTSVRVADFMLSHVRLQLDARYPWLMLIPQIEGAVELEDLSWEQLGILNREIVIAGAAVRDIGTALGRPVSKLNVGQLGNVTRQLHIHVVGRREDDPAWPGPVWGVGTAESYQAAALSQALATASMMIFDRP